MFKLELKYEKMKVSPKKNSPIMNSMDKEYTSGAMVKPMMESGWRQ